MSPLPQRIYVAGHRGMVGAAVCRHLARTSTELITATREQLDLRDTAATESFLRDQRPDAVIFAAGKVGGIQVNQRYPVEFLSDNARMILAGIEAAYRAGVPRLVFLGSTCVYPKNCPQPMHESSLMSGPLESSNEAYSLAKITGIKLCQFYRQQKGVLYHSVMPTNLYGPGDNYHPEHAHVLPALIRRFHEAAEREQAEVRVWGSGKPRREFLHVDCLADAIVHLLQFDDPPDWVNIGTGMDHSVMDVARMVAQTVGYRGLIGTDLSRPEGVLRKRCDVSLLHSLGWKHKIDLAEGIERVYRSFLTELRAGQVRSR